MSLLGDMLTRVETARRRAQYDGGTGKGVAAGSPPDFDGPASGAKPAPYAEPVRRLPRLGIAGPGIAPNAPKGDDGAMGAPVATLAPLPRSAPAMPILIAAVTPEPPDASAPRVGWRFVIGGALGLAVGWVLLSGDDA